MEFQETGAYEKRYIGLTSKTEYVVLFHESRSQWPSFVMCDM